MDNIQYVQNAVGMGGENCRVVCGSYVGTGTYGVDNPNQLNFNFHPIFILLFSSSQSIFNLIYPLSKFYWGSNRNVSTVWGENYTKWYYQTSDTSYDRPAVQLNASGVTYYYVAFGSADLPYEDSYIIDQSGTWIVPKTGNYYIELYGGGGVRGTTSTSYTGGSSCQSYDSVALTQGQKIAVTIGESGKNRTKGTGTSFGSYSVTPAGPSTSSNGGNGTGNKGTKGASGNAGAINYSTGVIGALYGYGTNADIAGNGAVYLKYLGE